MDKTRKKLSGAQYRKAAKRKQVEKRESVSAMRKWLQGKHNEDATNDGGDHVDDGKKINVHENDGGPEEGNREKDYDDGVEAADSVAISEVSVVLLSDVLNKSFNIFIGSKYYGILC